MHTRKLRENTKVTLHVVSDEKTAKKNTPNLKKSRKCSPPDWKSPENDKKRREIKMEIHSDSKYFPTDSSDDDDFKPKIYVKTSRLRNRMAKNKAAKSPSCEDIENSEEESDNDSMEISEEKEYLRGGFINKASIKCIYCGAVKRGNLRKHILTSHRKHFQVKNIFNKNKFEKTYRHIRRRFYDGTPMVPISCLQKSLGNDWNSIQFRSIAQKIIKFTGIRLVDGLCELKWNAKTKDYEKESKVVVHEEKESESDEENESDMEIENQNKSFHSSKRVKLSMKKNNLHHQIPVQSNISKNYENYYVKIYVKSSKRARKNYLATLRRVAAYICNKHNINPMSKYAEKQFMQKLCSYKEVQAFIDELRKTKMQNSSIINYIKEIIKYIGYCLNFKNLVSSNEKLHRALESSRDALRILQTNISYKIEEDHSEKVFVESQKMKERNVPHIINKQFSQDQIKLFHKCATKVENAFKRGGNLLIKLRKLKSEWTQMVGLLSVVFCMRNYQRPGVLSNMTQQEFEKGTWSEDGKYSILIVKHKTSASGPAAPALLPEEYDLFKRYYLLRKQLKCSSKTFLVNSKGKMETRVGQNIHRYQEQVNKKTNSNEDIVTTTQCRKWLYTDQIVEGLDEENSTRYLTHSKEQKRKNYTYPTANAASANRESVLKMEKAGIVLKTINSDLTKYFGSDFFSTFPDTDSANKIIERVHGITLGISSIKILRCKWEANMNQLRIVNVASRFLKFNRYFPKDAASKYAISKGWTASHLISGAEKLWQEKKKKNSKCLQNNRRR